MPDIKTLIQDLPVRKLSGDPHVPITNISMDSRSLRPGGLFFAHQGLVTDGHQFIPQAVAAGAVAVVCSRYPERPEAGVTYVQVEDVADATGKIAARFHGFPSAAMQVVGITGTNGKTTVATLLFNVFSSLGYKCGLISTVHNKIGNQVLDATHTTPDAVRLQALFATMRQQKVTQVFMEVSSHAVDQKRIAGTTFAGGVFTNISHDHLDYHKTFDAYIRAKKAFFDSLPVSAFALSNADDKRGAVMLQNTLGSKYYYGLRNLADFKGKVLSNTLDGLLMDIRQKEVHFRLSGLFNAYNLLAAYGVASLLGIDETEALATLSDLRGAPGRMETFRSAKQKILGIVDYAHTPDALINVLTTIKQFSGASAILTVVGCGGDRDKAKRPIMAGIACEHSNQVILTADNPRTEAPEAILDDMEAGLSPAQQRKVLRIVGRKDAIKAACQLAAPGDIILIAGKGHETYQEINGERFHFDDKEVLLEMFRLLGK